MSKYEWKKSEKTWYGAGITPQEVTVPPFGFFVIDGKGNPNGPEFARCVEALYALAYGVRMAPKNGLELGGWFEYTVYPLEGVWDLATAPSVLSPLNKDDLVFQLMIRQPDFVTPDAALRVQELVMRKKKLPHLAEVRFQRIEEGRCLQMLHVGPFDAEPASFSKMKDFCRKESLARVGHQHREIYLSDPSKTDATEFRTILRYSVRDNFSCD